MYRFMQVVMVSLLMKSVMDGYVLGAKEMHGQQNVVSAICEGELLSKLRTISGPILCVQLQSLKFSSLMFPKEHK